MTELEQTKHALAEALETVRACETRVMELQRDFAAHLESNAKEYAENLCMFRVGMQEAIDARKVGDGIIRDYKTWNADLEAEKLKLAGENAVLVEENKTLKAKAGALEEETKRILAENADLKARIAEKERVTDSVEVESAPVVVEEKPEDPDPKVAKKLLKAIKAQEAQTKKRLEKEMAEAEAARLKEIEEKLIEQRRLEFKTLELQAAMKKVDQLPEKEKRIEEKVTNGLAAIKTNERIAEKRLTAKLDTLTAEQRKLRDDKMALNEQMIHVAKALDEDAKDLLQHRQWMGGSKKKAGKKAERAAAGHSGKKAIASVLGDI